MKIKEHLNTGRYKCTAFCCMSMCKAAKYWANYAQSIPYDDDTETYDSAISSTDDDDDETPGDGEGYE